MELSEVIGVLILSVFIIIFAVGALESLRAAKYKDSLIFAVLMAVFAATVYAIARSLDKSRLTVNLGDNKKMTFGRDKSFNYSTNTSQLWVNRSS